VLGCGLSAVALLALHLRFDRVDHLRSLELRVHAANVVFAELLSRECSSFIHVPSVVHAQLVDVEYLGVEGFTREQLAAARAAQAR
jgi:hypothetical protein